MGLKAKGEVRKSINESGVIRPRPRKVPAGESIKREVKGSPVWWRRQARLKLEDIEKLHKRLGKEKSLSPEERTGASLFLNRLEKMSRDIPVDCRAYFLSRVATFYGDCRARALASLGETYKPYLLTLLKLFKRNRRDPFSVRINIRTHGRSLPFRFWFDRGGMTAACKLLFRPERNELLVRGLDRPGRVEPEKFEAILDKIIRSSSYALEAGHVLLLEFSGGTPEHKRIVEERFSPSGKGVYKLDISRERAMEALPSTALRALYGAG